LLLAGLPDEYKPMIMGIESSGTPITGEFIKTKLLQDIHFEQNSGNQQKAFISRKKGFKLGNKNTDVKKDSPRCYTCNNKYGHISRNCKNKSKKTNDKNSSEGSDKVFMTPFAYNVNKMEKIAKSTWCLDSGASSHMSPNKNQFFDLKDLPATPITMADNSIVESRGIGKIKINLIVNNNMQTIIAQEVVYVPNLACNLLSVRVLAKRGYKCVFKDNYCNVYDKRGALTACRK